MTESPPRISLIIPIGPKETTLSNFLLNETFLNGLATELEIILVCADPHFFDSRDVPQLTSLKIFYSPIAERAYQLNHGAAVATGEYLWFVHVDSKLKDEHFFAALGAATLKRTGIGYFDLDFQASKMGAALVLNKWGTYFRSHVFKMPFGDQAFICSKETFNGLGGFSREVDYGEDHCFIWTARLAKLEIYSLGVFLKTSARKYEKKGWLRTTVHHLRLTYLQAAPYAFKLLKGKVSGERRSRYRRIR